eukprot:8801940-Prorocentrum_lima.AAC.1
MFDTVCFILPLSMRLDKMRLSLFVKTERNLLQVSPASCDVAVLRRRYMASASVQKVLSQVG